MTSYRISLAAGLLCISALPLLLQAGSISFGQTSDTKTNKNPQKSAVHQSDGERKFAQNCGRCHSSPEGFPPHISGTIIRHMRVRASLSKQDEEDILHFLNP
jgi:mono/diheme cytochrome c family protein